MTGKFSYNFAGKKMAITYTGGQINNFREIWDWNAGNDGLVHYSICSSKCDAETCKIREVEGLGAGAGG